MIKKIEIECQSCKGTGLYQGCSERDNCATVCFSCKGTGKSTFSYKEFTSRKKLDNVSRVFKSSFGYVHTHEDIVSDEGIPIRFSEGGCTYDEWLQGVDPKPVKDLYCPYQWDNKGMGNEPLTECGKHCRLGLISDCKMFQNKYICWEKFEQLKSSLEGGN